MPVSATCVLGPHAVDGDCFLGCPCRAVSGCTERRLTPREVMWRHLCLLNARKGSDLRWTLVSVGTARCSERPVTHAFSSPPGAVPGKPRVQGQLRQLAVAVAASCEAALSGPLRCPRRK